jgi:hypothetical protein
MRWREKVNCHFVANASGMSQNETNIFLLFVILNCFIAYRNEASKINIFNARQGTKRSEKDVASQYQHKNKEIEEGIGEEENKIK